MMVPKENGEAREELKEPESDCEPGRNSVSSQGESQSTEEIKVRRPSRVPKNLTRKETTEGNSRSRRVSSDRHESNKLHFKASISNGTKFQKPDIVMSSSKSLSDLRNENVKISAKASSESSEGTDEKIIEENGTEEFKEIDIADETPNCDQSVGTDNETIETEENSLDEEKANPYQKIGEMESRIEKLEEELREVAALEVSLYSVVPEHGSSAHKLHTPARRLSRLYIHACKHGTQQQKASVAKNTVSGLVLIAKSCGNDVARLTFWLSNMVVLREIMSQAFGISSSPLSRMSAESNGVANKSDGKVSSQKWRSKQGNKSVTKTVLLKLVDDWQETSTFTSALERIESWMFSRIVESVWWQTLTPHMQGPPEGSYRSRGPGKLLGPSLGDHHQGNFSIDLWTDAFLDGFMRLCPVRAGGHECGCLPVLARMVMLQCMSRLDVAMFNAILRESANEIPTDPVSDPILDAKVLPMPAGDLSFGSGAQLKNSIGSWSRWLAELLGMDVEGETKYEQSIVDDDRSGGNIESKCFPLLSSLSDLLMLPKDMLVDKSIRMEVCPSIGLSLITRILCNFTPDEFCPDPVPGIVLEELNAERMSERRLSEKDPSFPYAAAPVVYCAPTVVDVAQKVADVNVGKVELGRNASMIQRRGYTSDEELDDLDSPLSSIIDKTPPVSPANANGKLKDNSAQTSVRFELLREVWSA